MQINTNPITGLRLLQKNFPIVKALGFIQYLVRYLPFA